MAFFRVPELDALTLPRYDVMRTSVDEEETQNTMINQFRGRSFAHPGCLIGITTGLTLGIVLAGILASVFNVALKTDLLIWLGLTVGLGAIGWIIGDRLSSRFQPLEEEAHDGEQE